VTALATIAFELGIGGTVTVYSAVNAAFLHALPYPDADRLVAIWQSSPCSSEIAVPYPIVLDWADGLAEVDGLAGYMGPGALNVTGDRAGDSSARVTSISRVTEPPSRSSPDASPSRCSRASTRGIPSPSALQRCCLALRLRSPPGGPPGARRRSTR